MEEIPVGVQAVSAVVLYPINAAMGVAVGVAAPFDEHYEIRNGPAGFLVGVLVPGFTLCGSLMQSGGRPIQCTEQEMDVLLKDDPFDPAAALPILSRGAGHGLILYVDINGKRHSIEPPASRAAERTAAPFTGS